MSNYQFIDLSHTIEDGMITYKGLPAPIICDYLSRADSRQFYATGTEFQIGKIEMVSNTGTYIDAPFHRFANGTDLSGLTLDQLAYLEGVLVDCSKMDGLAISKSFFEGLDVSDKAVLIRTDWSKHWATDQYFENHPFLTEAAAAWLKQNGAKLVGIDSHNIDDTRNNSRPVHTILLGAGILIVEHMCNLSAIPDKPFKFTAVPPKVKDFGTFPVRAFAAVATDN